MRKKKNNSPIISVKDTRFRSALLAVMRRFSRFWHPSKEVLTKARIARGIYTCNICKKVVGPKEIKVDHIEPVVPVTGFTNWDDIIGRLFCGEEGLQAICHPCHTVKTTEENRKRKFWKKEKAVLQYYKDKQEKKEDE
jgi:hypothetical protein